MPGGRPSDYTPERGEAICRLIEIEARGLMKLHRNHPDVVPEPSTVNRWLSQHPEFRQRYARARDIQADLLADEALSILDDCQFAGYDREANAAVSKAREQATHRRWMAGRLAPKRWGDRMEHDLGEGAASALADLVKKANG